MFSQHHISWFGYAALFRRLPHSRDLPLVVSLSSLFFVVVVVVDVVVVDVVAVLYNFIGE